MYPDACSGIYGTVHMTSGSLRLPRLCERRDASNVSVAQENPAPAPLEGSLPAGTFLKADEYCVAVSFVNAMVGFSEPDFLVQVPPTPPWILIAVCCSISL